MNNVQFEIIVSNLVKNLLKEIRHEIVEFDEVVGKFQGVSLMSNQDNYLVNPVLNEKQIELENIIKLEKADMERAAIFAAQKLQDLKFNIEFKVEGNFWNLIWKNWSLPVVDAFILKFC